MNKLARGAMWTAVALCAPVIFGYAASTASPRPAAPGLTQTLPKFAVISIKPLPPGSHMTGGRPRPIYPGGWYRDTQTPLGKLIAFAYPETNFPGVTLFGAPDWVFGAQLFDIEAGPAPGKVPSQDEMRLMMRAALADRFKLRFHTENREMPVFFLVVGKGGPKNLARADPSHEAHALQAVFGSDNVYVIGRGFSIQELAGSGIVLSLFRRPIIDHTGLAGYYDITLPPTPETAAQLAMSPQADPRDLLLEYMRKNLGLDLVSGRAPVTVMVIDHVQPPTPN